MAVTGSRDSFSLHARSNAPIPLPFFKERLARNTQNRNRVRRAFITWQCLWMRGGVTAPDIFDEEEAWFRDIASFSGLSLC